MRKLRYWTYWKKLLRFSKATRKRIKNSKISRRKEIIKIQEEINEKEMKKNSKD